jgi:methionyl-tRNA formyltransferase
MKYLVFCDESTLPFLNYALRSHDSLFVTAFNRPQAQSLALRLSIPSLIQVRKNSDFYQEFVEKVTLFNADYLFCASYGLLIPDTVLKCVTHGAINFHGGILPQWRGANILNWAIIEGCETTGVTAHWMTAEIDKGPIVAVRTIPITFKDTALTLREKLLLKSESLFLELLNKILKNESLDCIEQDEASARYFRRRTPEDGRIDWNKSDLEIYNLIRALVNPWPGAFTQTEDGSKVIFDKFVPLEEISSLRAQYLDVRD